MDTPDAREHHHGQARSDGSDGHNAHDGHGGHAPVPAAARAVQGRPAGVVTRLVAGTLDGVLVVLALLAAYGAVAGVVFLLDPRGYTAPAAGWLLSLTTAWLVAFGYLAVAWSLGGRTYGALVMGLRVLGPRGRPLGPVVALARALLCVLVPIGVLWVAVSRRQRSLQDLALGTSVVYDWSRGTSG